MNPFAIPTNAPSGTNIVAQPVQPQVYIWAGGFFDQLFIGLPLYLWIMILFIFVIFIGAIWGYYVWYMVMYPVKGYFAAYRENIPQAINIGRNRKGKFIPVKYLAKVFEAMDLPLRWQLTSSTASFGIGGVSTIITRDDWAIPIDVKICAAIVQLKNRWNEMHPGENERIHDWQTFQEHLMKGDFEEIARKNQIFLPPFEVVDIYEVSQYFPVEKMDAASFFGFIERRAKEIAGSAAEQGNKMLIYAGVFASVIIIACVFGYLILTMAK